MKKTPAIELTNVTFRYRQDIVLEHLNFSITQGDYVGIIGPNGSGKTTLLKIMLGLLEPDNGEVKLFGKPLSNKALRDVAYIPQRIDQGEIDFPATVREIVQSGKTSQLGVLGRMNKKQQDAVQKALKTANIAKLSDRRLSDLSGGQRQRVMIARALAFNPKILILDEPTVGVDVRSQEEFYTFIHKLNKEHGLTIILVTHEIDVVANEVSHLLCVNRTITYHGTPTKFVKGDYLTKLYGKNVKMILHDH